MNLPTSPPAPADFTMTEHRLWLLYNLASFSHSKICEELTNWPWHVVKNAIRKWNLERRSYAGERGWTADAFVEHRLADRLPLLLDEETQRLLAGSREALQAWTRERIREGQAGWRRLDALPGPDDVLRWVKDWMGEAGVTLPGDDRAEDRARDEGA